MHSLLVLEKRQIGRGWNRWQENPRLWKTEILEGEQFYPERATFQKDKRKKDATPVISRWMQRSCDILNPKHDSCKFNITSRRLRCYLTWLTTRLRGADCLYTFELLALFEIKSPRKIDCLCEHKRYGLSFSQNLWHPWLHKDCMISSDQKTSWRTQSIKIGKRRYSGNDSKPTTRQNPFLRIIFEGLKT